MSVDRQTSSGTAGKNDNNAAPALNMTESKVAMQAIVDPYSRAAFFLSEVPKA